MYDIQQKDNNSNDDDDVDDPDRVIFLFSLFSISSSSLLSLFSVSHLILLFFLPFAYVCERAIIIIFWMGLAGLVVVMVDRSSVGVPLPCCVSCFSLSFLVFNFSFSQNSTSLIFNSSLSSYFSHNEYEEEKKTGSVCV